MMPIYFFLAHRTPRSPARRPNQVAPRNWPSRSCVLSRLCNVSSTRRPSWIRCVCAINWNAPLPDLAASPLRRRLTCTRWPWCTSSADAAPSRPPSLDRRRRSWNASCASSEPTSGSNPPPPPASFSSRSSLVS